MPNTVTAEKTDTASLVENLSTTTESAQARPETATKAGGAGSSHLYQLDPLISVGGSTAAALSTRGADPALLRRLARMAGMQTEVRLLGRLAATGTQLGVRSYLGLQEIEGVPHTVIRGRREKRLDLPVDVKYDMLDRFCADYVKTTESPKTLLIVAHPDDESVGAGARLCRLSDAEVIYVTDGAPRDERYARANGYSTRSEYAAARMAEAEFALSLVGVPNEHIRCLGVVDGEASYHLIELAVQLADKIEAAQPDVVVTHPYEGGHTDHDSTAFAVHLACGLLRRDGVDAPAILEMTSYHHRNGTKITGDFLPVPGVAPRTVQLAEQDIELKRRLFQCYISQGQCLAEFSVEREKFRPAPRYVFTVPPHDGKLNYERYGKRVRLSGDEWRRHATEALSALRTGRLFAQAA